MDTTRGGSILDTTTDERRLIALNSMATPDGTILISRSRHDCVTHIDDITGETYMTDGGIDYIRRNVNKVPAVDLTLYMDEPHDIIRLHVCWGTYGKDGNQPLKWKPIYELDTNHIHKILEIPTLHPNMRQMMYNELTYRDNVGKESNDTAVG